MTNQIASNLRNILQRIQDAALKQTINVSYHLLHLNFILDSLYLLDSILVLV